MPILQYVTFVQCLRQTQAHKSERFDGLVEDPCSGEEVGDLGACMENGVDLLTKPSNYQDQKSKRFVRMERKVAAVE